MSFSFDPGICKLVGIHSIRVLQQWLENEGQEVNGNQRSSMYLITLALPKVRMDVGDIFVELIMWNTIEVEMNLVLLYVMNTSQSRLKEYDLHVK